MKSNGSTNPRGERRHVIWASVEYFAGKLPGRGTIRDMSVCGARILCASAAIRNGVALTLKLGLLGLPEGRPIALSGEVVRQVPTGFAVRFVRVDAQTEDTLRSLLPRAAERLRASQKGLQWDG